MEDAVFCTVSVFRYASLVGIIGNTAEYGRGAKVCEKIVARRAMSKVL